jgi:hypothetical protein
MLLTPVLDELALKFVLINSTCDAFAVFKSKPTPILKSDPKFDPK